MAGPGGNRTGQLKARFGQSSKRVPVPAKALMAARSGKGRLYEDGSYVAKRRSSKKP